MSAVKGLSNQVPSTKNNHSSDINFKLQLDQSNHLNVHSHFVYCRVPYTLLCKLDYGYHNKSCFHQFLPNRLNFNCKISHELWLSFDTKFSKTFKKSEKSYQARFKEKFILKGPYANHILIPQGSTGSSIFFDIKWKPIFFLFQIQNFSFKFFVVLEIQQKVWS